MAGWINIITRASRRHRQRGFKYRGYANGKLGCKQFILKY
jgi:hypothetical protein